MSRLVGLLRAATPLMLALFPFTVIGIRQDGEPTLPPDYLAGRVFDPVTKLAGRIASGTTKLQFEPEQGYLRSVLKELGIAADTQILVFSKTSFQAPYISPTNPRALYFNQNTYVGWIRGAPYMELIGVDPTYGPVFYTLENRASGKAALTRQTYDCLQCHDTPMTMQVPGLMARSVLPGPDGTPRLAGGSFQTTSSSPLEERWGGWYVTGRHGSMRHMGNQLARGDDATPTLDKEAGANVTDLSRYFDTSHYLEGQSDIAALLVAEQQMHIQNLLTKTATLTRAAIRDANVLSDAGWEAGHVAMGLQDRVDHACEPLVRALLCADEPMFRSPIESNAGFNATFSHSAPADHEGRRLSQLDLHRRLLQYPCSPMIYSPAFNALPPQARSRILARLHEVLDGHDGPTAFSNLATSDRVAIQQILSSTLPGFDADPK